MRLPCIWAWFGPPWGGCTPANPPLTSDREYCWAAHMFNSAGCIGRRKSPWSPRTSTPSPDCLCARTAYSKSLFSRLGLALYCPIWLCCRTRSNASICSVQSIRGQCQSNCKYDRTSNYTTPAPHLSSPWPFCGIRTRGPRTLLWDSSLCTPIFPRQGRPIAAPLSNTHVFG